MNYENIYKFLNSIQVGFVASWTPYAFVSFYTGFIDEHAVSPFGATMPAFLMKTSMVWSTVFFVFSSKNIKEKLEIIQLKNIDRKINAFFF